MPPGPVRINPDDDGRLSAGFLAGALGLQTAVVLTVYAWQAPFLVPAYVTATALHDLTADAERRTAVLCLVLAGRQLVPRAERYTPLPVVHEEWKRCKIQSLTHASEDLHRLHLLSRRGGELVRLPRTARARRQCAEYTAMVYSYLA